ncbi:partner of Y14 and mago-like [Mercenaria mercenaria]|uniref:partner of Y14 and mago-like n=1 Tax=Mercenaria mercenaria TaxID=6596 RepID=UPI00234EFE1E|nr:partner of Y14 and mago-like [Mercenaria mercenaria]
MATSTIERTGVVQDESTGEKYIPASRRPDGTWRKPRRVKDGFVPQEEMPVYENKGVQWLKSKPLLPPGLDPSGASSGNTQVSSSEPMSKAAKKNAKRKEKKKQQQQEGNQSGTSMQNVTQSLAGVKINNDQPAARSKTNDQSDFKVAKQTGENSDKQEITKKLKNLKKKLKQIEDLEKRIQSGELKNPEKEQLEKIGKKKIILDEIEDLELDLDD